MLKKTTDATVVICTGTNHWRITH